jgi:dipeptidyl aminopeptidase/acylaminoacyl peptidase
MLLSRTVLAGVMVSALLWGQPGLAEDKAAVTTPSAAASAASTPAVALGVQDFAALNFVQSASLSPNGEWMAGLFGVNGQSTLCAMSLFDKTAKRTCVALADGQDAYSIQWVNDDNFIVHVHALVPVDEKSWYVSRLVSINRVTGKVTRLMWDLAGQTGDDVIWTARDGSPTVLVGAQASVFTGEDFWPAIYRVNVETGAKFKVLPGRENVMGWVADSAGQVRLGYGYDDDRRNSRLWYRGEAGGTFHTIDRADARQRKSTVEPMGFIAGTDHALVVHEDDKGLSTVFESDLNPVKDLKPIYVAPEGSWVDDVILADDAQTLLGVSLRGKLQKRVWIEPTLANVQEALDKAVGTQRLRILSFSRDRKRMLILVDRPESPGALYYFDVDNPVMHRLAYINEHMRNTPLSPARMITYHARDGLEIEAVVTTPRNPSGGTPGKNLPVIVMPHGGPWAHDTLDYDYWAQFLAERGYLVIQPNFRGSTGYGQAFERKGEGQLGLAMQDDVNDALAWAVKEGLADGKRACIVGASYGGYAAMWGAARDPDLWRCAVSIAGVSSLRREVNDMGYHSLSENGNHDAWSRMTPDFPAVSPINSVDKIKVPMLLVHGKKDVTVDVSQSITMAAKMRAAGKQVDFVQIPLADHYYQRQADRQALLEALGTFLDKYNPAH